MLDHFLAVLGQLAVAARVGGDVHDDGPLAHALDHRFRDQLGRGATGHLRGRDDHVGGRDPGRDDALLLLQELGADFLGVAAFARATLLHRQVDELGAERFDLLFDLGANVADLDHGAQALGGRDRL